MPPSFSNVQPYPLMPLLSRLVAVGALWLLALSYWGTDANRVSESIAQDSTFAKWDMPLHARGETQSAFERVTSRVNADPQIDMPPKVWLLLIGADIAPYIIVKPPVPVFHRQHIYLQQLQGLDSARAPPFV